MQSPAIASGLFVLTLLAGCGAPAPGDGSAGVEPAGEPAPLDAAFAGDLAAVASAYTGFGRVDEMLRWAPELCMAPPAPLARFSASGDDGTHGRKLYAIFALHPERYAGYPESAPLWDVQLELSREYDQILVKQSWKPALAEEGPEKAFTGALGSSGLAPAERDGELWMAKEQLDLFVMMHTDPATPGTDEGWVYGTVAPDGETVTAVGRMASCMKCHTRAPHGRLFGLPDAEHPPR